MAEALANPFLEDLFVDLPTHLPGVERVHQEAFARIREAVESLLRGGASVAVGGVGRLFLLTANEAGYGKTHLVARLRDHLGGVAPTLYLPFDRSRPITWPVALSSVLRQFATRNRPGAGSLPLLEELSRYYLARLLLGALASGEWKRRDCPEEAHRIEQEYASLLSLESDSKLLPWLDRRAKEVAQAADEGLSQRLAMGKAELAFWTRVFIDLNLREEGALDPLRGLSSGEARERLLQFLRIATLPCPAMLVADGLDGFHRSETAGMEIAEIVNGIREKVPHTVTVVCVNEDVWTSVFVEGLPSAWRDRLTGETLRLGSIDVDAALELIRFRLRRTGLSEAAAACFAKRVAEDSRWREGRTPLSPRRVLREARELWWREASYYLESPEPKVEYQRPARPPHPPQPRTEAEAGSPRPRMSQAPVPPRVRPPEPPLERAYPGPEFAESAIPGGASQASFQASSAPSRDADLAGIDSIINDIRGTGKTVVSEAAEPDSLEPLTSLRPQRPEGQAEAVASVPPVAVATPATALTSCAASPVSAPVSPPRERVPIPRSFFADLPPRERTQEAKAPEAAVRPPLTRAAFDRALAERESELLASVPLKLDRERLSRFLQQLGARHAALGQREERFPSSLLPCLRWDGRGHSVLVGFESSRNAQFWNHLLQQSLASNRLEKIAAFSHASDPFELSLFAGFGFSPAVVRGRIDLIAMNDRELAMIQAAEQVYRQYEATPDADQVGQWVILRLDPLWRRLIQPL